MQRIPEPNVCDLLLPLLSCLPTAFLSPRPPPALPPLLSPILRQRVHLRSSNTIASAVDPASSASNWLSLLTWSPAGASQLVEVCSNLQLEPHPVSGELELFGDDSDPHAGKAHYRRLDVETLQARCDVREHGLCIIWMWCENDSGFVGLPGEEGSGGEAQNGWRVADVQALDEEDGSAPSSSGWYGSIKEAEETYLIRNPAQAGSDAKSASAGALLSTDPRSNGNHNSTPGAASNLSGDDDDYWASYDRTPSGTPGQKSPAPASTSTANGNNIYDPSRDRQHSTSQESDYYARYGSVQPAMDAHDPDEEETASAYQSTLRPGFTSSGKEQPPGYDTLGYANGSDGLGNQSQRAPIGDSAEDDDMEEPPITVAAATVPLRIHSPTPSRPSTSSSGGRRSPIEALEASATTASAAEIGVKHHISTELKSLYRLAKVAGIDRSEFKRVIKTELELLYLMDE